jgi:hypothetical protein
MATDLQKLAIAMRAIKQRFPVGGKRYDRVVENPFESGYWPLRKPTVKDRSDVRRILRKRSAAKSAAARAGA